MGVPRGSVGSELSSAIRNRARFSRTRVPLMDLGLSHNELGAACVDRTRNNERNTNR